MNLLARLQTAFFFEKNLEIDYRAYLYSKSITMLRVAILLSILLFLFFGVLDIYIAREYYQSMWIFRLIYCLYAIIILAYSYTVFFEALNQLIMTSLVIVGAICLVGIILVPFDTQASDLYYVTFILLIFFNFTLTNINFSYAFINALIIAFVYILSSILYLDVLKEGWLSEGGLRLLSNSFFLLISVVMGGIICLVIEYYRRKEFLQRKSLDIEKKKANDLLLNILPISIVERLRESSSTIADEYPKVSILFADLVGFTPLASTKSPKELVAMLDSIFSKFDWLAEKYKLEKIKTIGDAYMVAGGIQDHTNHAVAMADMSLAMQREIVKYNRRFDTNLQLRIGIHVGPIVAGVIGNKKFSYDMWGDTVNIASRMESSSIPGEIQISKSMYNELKQHFMLVHRGSIPIKGKGKMDTYLLKG